MKRFAIVGFGCAGYHAAKALREYCPGCRIDVYSDTDTAPANPMLTTYYVAGRISRQEMFPFGSKEEVIKELDINFYENMPVVKVSVKERSVFLLDGSTRTYDDIVLASGSYPVVPPIPGLPKKGIYVMRTVQDADSLLESIEGGISSALVIGASWVGIKVIEALHAHQVPSTLADLAPYIFSTAALPEVAEIIHSRLRELGIKLMFGHGIASMRGETDGIVSTFDDGSEVKSQIVVLCMGLRPAVGYLKDEDIAMGRGVQVNTHMCSSVPHIYAVGDCCETREILSGAYTPVYLWANAAVQGRIAGRNIAGYPDEYEGCFVHNITHFLNMDFIGLGNPRLSGETVEFGNVETGNYARVIIQDGKMQCANILGNYRVSGFLKSWFLRQREQPGTKMPDVLRANLLREGLDETFISLIGGNGV